MIINFFVKMIANCNKVIYDVEKPLRSIHIWLRILQITFLKLKFRHLFQMTNFFFAYQKLRVSTYLKPGGQALGCVQEKNL